MAAMLSAMSCNNAVGPMATELYYWADSTACAYLTVDAELPSGNDKASAAVRRELSGVVDDILSRITSYEDERFFPPFDGDGDDIHAMLDYYRDNAFGVISRLAQEDADERAAFITEGDFTDEEKESMLASFPRWAYEFSLRKVEDKDRYVVFQSRDYIYQGGAHGGVTGKGCLTFSKEDGRCISAFVDPSKVGDLQPIIIKGLLEYWSEGGYEATWDDLRESLFIEDGVVPLPAWPLFPADEGIVFIYQQYEIAAYAMGMPSFTVPYDEIGPYLTDEARQLLGL